MSTLVERIDTSDEDFLRFAEVASAYMKKHDIHTITLNIEDGTLRVELDAR